MNKSLRPLSMEGIDIILRLRKMQAVYASILRKQKHPARKTTKLKISLSPGRLSMSAVLEYLIYYEVEFILTDDRFLIWKSFDQGTSVF